MIQGIAEKRQRRTITAFPCHCHEKGADIGILFGTEDRDQRGQNFTGQFQQFDKRRFLVAAAELF
jgi:hypothetical protein